uniref:Uncharacterized protein n=1 Tax=Anguilla anguilla TaxID=7936 RepID=A0A0E9SBD7_ANGAN
MTRALHLSAVTLLCMFLSWIRTTTHLLLFTHLL